MDAPPPPTTLKSRAEELEGTFDTAQLGQLRSLLEKPTFRPLLISGLIRLRVVVDANCVVQSLIYRQRNPNCRATALEETVKSTVLEVHAPRWLDLEMRSAIAHAAERQRLSPVALWARWEELRPLLIWDDSLAGPDYEQVDCCDPKDVAYVELERKIGAAGILSKDRHIRKLGGHALDQDFLLDAKRYARAAGVSVSIRVCGVLISAVTLKVAADAVLSICRLFARLPPAAQGLLVLGGIAAVLHPQSRRWLGNRLELLAEASQPALKAIIVTITQLAQVSVESQGRADAHLRQMQRALRPQPVQCAGAAAK